MANTIKRQSWVSSFNLVGVAKITNYTYKMDEQSQKSAWQYSQMNLGVDCGEKCGTVYANMMGGFSTESQSMIYAHGKKEDGSDDFENQIQVAWEDRKDESILEQIGDLCFITVGIEKTKEGKTFYQKFLSEYDAIAYCHEHLVDGMVVNVRGNIKYQLYNGVTTVQKNITSIALSKAEAKDYRATFVQSILIDKDSASLRNIDKDKNVMYVNAIVLDYMKELDGVLIKGQYPFKKQFEMAVDINDEKRTRMIYDKMFDVQRNITQLNMEGEFIEGGATVNVTLDDIPQDIKDLIGIVYTEEEALERCSSNAPREQRMVMLKPRIIQIEKDDVRIPSVQIFKDMYKPEEIYIDYGTNTETPTDTSTETSSAGDMADWLANLA